MYCDIMHHLIYVCIRILCVKNKIKSSNFPPPHPHACVLLLFGGIVLLPNENYVIVFQLWKHFLHFI